MRDRPADGKDGSPAEETIQYRGRAMPDGLTPAMFDELEALFVEFERDEFVGFASDAALRAFAISSRSLRS